MEHPDPARKLSANLYDIPLLSVQWKTPDDGQGNCPKHVEFHSKIKISEIGASSWFCYKKFITMHGHMNVRLVQNKCCYTVIIYTLIKHVLESNACDGKSR